MIRTAGIKGMDYRNVTGRLDWTWEKKRKGNLAAVGGASANPYDVSGASIMLSYFLDYACLAQ